MFVWNWLAHSVNWLHRCFLAIYSLIKLFCCFLPIVNRTQLFKIDRYIGGCFKSILTLGQFHFNGFPSKLFKYFLYLSFSSSNPASRKQLSYLTSGWQRELISLKQQITFVSGCLITWQPSVEFPKNVIVTFPPSLTHILLETHQH